jgi:hypothetical protein
MPRKEANEMNECRASCVALPYQKPGCLKLTGARRGGRPSRKLHPTPTVKNCIS